MNKSSLAGRKGGERQRDVEMLLLYEGYQGYGSVGQGSVFLER